MLKLTIRGTARAINMNSPSLEEEEMVVRNVLETLAEESKATSHDGEGDHGQVLVDHC